VLLALRPTQNDGPLIAEARAFQGVVSADNQLDVDTFVAAVARGSTSFQRLEKPPIVTPVEHSSASMDKTMEEEELYDPLLSNKRYERETAL